jgi:hypothetical protein
MGILYKPRFQNHIIIALKFLLALYTSDSPRTFYFKEKRKFRLQCYIYEGKVCELITLLFVGYLMKTAALTLLLASELARFAAGLPNAYSIRKT